MRKAILLFCLISLTLASCHKVQLTTLHLKEGEYLLKKNKIEIKQNKSIDKDDLKLYLRQKPNKAYFFGTWKIGLQWKNIWYREKKGKPRPAVIVDTAAIARSEKQLGIYLQNLGYYNAKVTSSTRRTRILGIKYWQTKKMVVKYEVEPGRAFFIDSLGTVIPDSAIAAFHQRELKGTALKKGEALALENLQIERERISKSLQNKGYYDFAENYIQFDVDTNLGDYRTALITKIKNPKNETNRHQRYYIRKVYVQTDYDPYKKQEVNDTIFADHNLFFVSDGSSKFSHRPISRAIFIKPGSNYAINDYNLTYKRLLSLQMFQLIDIDYEKVELDDTSSIDRALDVFIRMTPSKKMTISTEAVGTFREGFGANGQVSFSQKNPFKGSEIIEFSVNGGFEQIKSSTGSETITAMNIGPRLSLRLPSLLFLPKLSRSLAKTAFPKSVISTAYNYQKREDFTRYLSNFYLKYEFNEGLYKKHEINILDFSFTFITKDSKVLTALDSLTLYEQFRFQDNISIGIKYRFLYNNQNKPKIKHPIYVLLRADLIGLSTAFTKWAGIEARDNNDAISWWGVRYSNYLKVDGDYRYYYHLNPRNTVVARAFAGIAIPFDEFSVIPYEQLYFAGGANSIRGWQQRTLGPGAYNDSTNFYDRLGEIKLEANLEYRFPIYGIFKGAAFADVGNIWQLENEQDGAIFTGSKFYKQLAFSPGLGVRLDFDFFLFRVDGAFPLKEPFLDTTTPFAWNIINWNFGIGYPF